MSKTTKILNLKGVLSILICVAILFALVANSLSVSAASYKGSGTKADPYLVETAEQLQDMRRKVDAHYKLANTIDLSSIANFTPIGNLEKPFTGTFTCELNADNTPKYIIKNLKINVAAIPIITKDTYQKNMHRMEAALFGAAEGATLSGIYVMDVDVTNLNLGENTGSELYNNARYGMDEMNAAALVGQANSCTITNCASSGAIKGKAARSGGLIGDATDSAVSYCYSTASVTSEALFMVGGLMGCSRNSVVEFSYATGNVSCAHRGAASLAGSVFGSSISNCYATGNTSGGGQSITNFCGDRESGTTSYENCYATGTTTNGAQSETANLSNCWTLSGTKSFMLGFKEGSAADIKAAFTGLEGWDTSGEYPKLTGIGVVDSSTYQPGAVTEVPATDGAQGSTGTTGATGATGATGGTTTGGTTTTVGEGASQEQILAEFIKTVNKLPKNLKEKHWKQLISAQKLYEQLSEETLIDLPTEVRGKFLSAKTSVQQDILLYLKKNVDKIPSAKKVKASDKENIEYLYDLHKILPEAAQEALDPELKKKLLDSHKAASKLKTDDAASSNLTQPEIILIAVLCVLIIGAMAKVIYWLLILLAVSVICAVYSYIYHYSLKKKLGTGDVADTGEAEEV